MKRLIVIGALALAACSPSEPVPAPDYSESEVTTRATSPTRARTCADADGPYVKGRDPEYDQFEDRDQGGIVCEGG
jgi:hypothetical protein